MTQPLDIHDRHNVSGAAQPSTRETACVSFLCCFDVQTFIGAATAYAGTDSIAFVVDAPTTDAGLSELV